MPTTTLLCKECKFENEPERVYCHNCGAKLDRALLPPEAIKREDPVEVQRHLQRMTRPKGGGLFPILKNLFKSLLIAALLAGVILALRPPTNVPVPTQDQTDNARTLGDDLAQAESLPTAHTLVFTEDTVNAYLAAYVHPRKGADTVYGFHFERGFVHFWDKDFCQINLEQSVFGYPIYAGAVYQVEIKDGKLVTKTVGGNIGRLPVPAGVMKYLGAVALQPFFMLEQNDRKAVERMESIDFGNGTVTLVTKPGE